MTLVIYLSSILYSPSSILYPPPRTPEAKALAYLAREVPAWSADNKCYSCHNNGDAARALYVATRLGHPVPPKALADTTRWLTKPDGWDDNGGDYGTSDKKLARIQFAAALVEAMDAGLVKDREALAKAAALVAARQDKDGSWPIDAEGALGSPTTYGTALATFLARRTLHKAGPKKYAAAIARSDAWFRQVKVENVLDAAAVLLALGKDTDDAAMTQRRHCLALIRKGEAKDGGWGPYLHSAPEAFDTAVVVLALMAQPETDETKALRRRGRAFLIAAQKDDGSWEETTRPAARASYAQRISTTGWATLALLASSH
jgi:hypothetical protein